MNFAEVRESVCRGLAADPPNARMLRRLKAAEPFCHVRFNDGESLCAFGLRRPHEKNNCGHHYYPDLGAELRVVLDEIHLWPQNVLLGSYWHAQGSDVAGLDEAAQALVWHLGDRLPDYPWANSDDLVDGLASGIPLPIFDEVRRQAKEGRPTLLVGPPHVRDGRHMLGAEFVEIPRFDCWSATRVVLDQCRPLADRDACFVWCCGMSKPWPWHLWRRNGRTTHLDAGHLFDACFGEFSRAYSRRRDRSEEKWRAYEDVFIPYCQSFVPKK